MLAGQITIGRLSDLSEVGQLAVLALRGLDHAPGAIPRDLVAAIGPLSANKAMARCDDLAQLISQYSTRPLVRNDLHKQQTSGDEAVFAEICTLALSGQREDMLILAMTLCRADVAPCVLPLAEALALTLAQGLARAALRPIYL